MLEGSQHGAQGVALGIVATAGAAVLQERGVDVSGAEAGSEGAADPAPFLARGALVAASVRWRMDVGLDEEEADGLGGHRR